MNIGIIGCGSISSQYMIGLNKSEKDFNVVACADQDFEKSKRKKKDAVWPCYPRPV